VKAWPRFIPDLTLWHPWHSDRGTLPDRFQGMGLPEICRSLGVPCWQSARPWRVELHGITVREERGATEKTLVWETAAGALTSRWTRGPDGDWWQAEYPVKTPADLKAAREVAEARRYVIDPDVMADSRRSTVDDIVAFELPQRPWSELFHAFLGWSEGLMLFLEEPRAVQEIARTLEEKLAGLVDGIAALPGAVILSPDNLDGQFVTPAAFEENLAPSYRRTADALHEHGKRLVVHVGGPVRRLLPGLAGCGVDCVEGVCGAPQGNSTLAEARSLCGPEMELWGGIAQDFLLANRSETEFEEAVAAALSEAANDVKTIAGVADRVPVEALPGRLEKLVRMAAERFTR
jgi:hypothetical protein